MVGGKLKVVGGLLGACLVVAGLSGCNNAAKEKAASLEQQNVELTSKVTELQTSNREKDIQINGLQSELSAARTAPAPAPQGPAYVANKDDGKSPPRTTPRRPSETLEIAGDVAFLSGSATLTPAAKKELDTFAAKLKKTYAGRSIRVEGHTDSKPITKSKWSSNEALSQARAEAVRSYLVSKGVSSSRIEAIGYGAAKPKSTPAASRRVDVVVLAD
jgi:outer membrane protein OmpA-like peptidoglycan-associated protein